VGVIWSSHTFVYVVGSLLCGKVVPKVGRKKLTGITVLAVGFFTIVYTHAPNYYVSILSGLSIVALSAFWSASSRDLALAQVPEYQGAMMSLNSGSTRLGGALGLALGGFILTVGSYGLLGLVMGGIGITAFLVIFFFARDPSHIVTAQLPS
jgi:predicted MFS family arabinose efflux permease